MTDSIANRIEGGRRLKEGARARVPLVSIITVVFRAAQELPPLMESIVAHRGEDTEWIVIDGGSDDGSIDILRQFDDSIDYWISEPDGGIYDAMNKGIAAATGEYVLHINAGDWLKCIPRESLRRCSADCVDIACFSVDIVHREMFHPGTGLELHIRNVWHHQGAFYRRSSHPGYDIQYRVFSDFDCNQKMLKAGASVRRFQEVVAEQRIVGISGSGIADGEMTQIILANFGFRWVALRSLWEIYMHSRVLLKQLLMHFVPKRK